MMRAEHPTGTSHPEAGEVEDGAPDASSLSPLMRDFLRWVASAPRTHAEAMEAWRTSCPRFSIWEDALADDLIRLEHDGGGRMGEARVTLSPSGQARLREHTPLHH